MIVSSLAEEGAEQTVAALALGAADTLPKPGTGRFNGRFSEVLLGKLKALGYADPQLAAGSRAATGSTAHRCCARCRPIRSTLLAIGASTGGIHALGAFFEALPEAHRRADPGHAASAGPVHGRLRAPARRCRQARGAGRRRRHGAAAGPHHRRAGRRASDRRPMASTAPVVRLTAAAVAQRLHAVASIRCLRRSARSSARARSASCSPAWAATGSKARRGWSRRRLRPRAGRGELRRLGHAARGPRGRPRLRRPAARQDRAADRVADRGAALVQISDSSSRILAGLLEARTGQQLTMSRRWRIETALSSLLRERGIATLDELITILVMGKEPSLSQPGRRGAAQQRNLFLPRPRAVRPAASAMRCRSSRKRARSEPSGCASGRRAARPGQEAYSLAMLFAEEPREVARLDHRHPRHRRIDLVRRSRAAAASTASSKSSAASASTR